MSEAEAYMEWLSSKGYTVSWHRHAVDSTQPGDEWKRYEAGALMVSVRTDDVTVVVSALRTSDAIARLKGLGERFAGPPTGAGEISAT